MEYLLNYRFTLPYYFLFLYCTPAAHIFSIARISTQWVTVPKAVQCFLQVQTNINRLLRELSGPRPLCWGTGTAKAG